MTTPQRRLRPWGGATSVPERTIYIARRNSAFDRTQFVHRWRAHWALVGSMAEAAAVRRYIQCEVLYDTDAHPRDGIASSEFFSPELRRTIRAAAEFRRIAQADERETFAAIVGECLFVAHHHVLLGAGSGPFKLVRFVRRRANLGCEDFGTAWLRDFARSVVAAAPSELLGYAQSHPIEPEPDKPWTLDADGLEEFWFADEHAARRFLESAAFEAANETSGLFAPGMDAVVSNEIMLKDVR